LVGKKGHIERKGGKLSGGEIYESQEKEHNREVRGGKLKKEKLKSLSFVKQKEVGREAIV